MVCFEYGEHLLYMTSLHTNNNSIVFPSCKKKKKSAFFFWGGGGGGEGVLGVRVGGQD